MDEKKGIVDALALMSRRAVAYNKLHVGFKEYRDTALKLRKRKALGTSGTGGATATSAAAAAVLVADDREQAEAVTRAGNEYNTLCGIITKEFQGRNDENMLWESRARRATIHAGQPNATPLDINKP